MKGEEALDLLRFWARATGLAISIPSEKQLHSFRIQGKSGDLGSTYWGGAGFRPFDGQTPKQLPRVVAALVSTSHLMVFRRGGWTRVGKDEFLAKVRKQLQVTSQR